ncbi:glycogen synthase GlgA [Aromatoleum sp.]|uniref:glycogen synthase GlgA n=1 Tax=Aromatoleum sp. TaxID=2307007 RepID=UPI002FCAB630
MKKLAKPRVLFATPECTPWAKTGGLGDVSAGLPEALAALDLDLRLLLPAYPSVRAAAKGARRVANLRAEFGLPAATLLRARLPSGVPALIVDCPSLYARKGGPYLDVDGTDYADNALRFGLLSRVAARLASDDSPLGWRADVLHCNDWHCALAPAYLAHGLPAPAPSLVTVHNLAFQGIFDLDVADALGLPPASLKPDGVEFWGRLSFLKAGLFYADRIATVSPTYAREIRSKAFGCGLEGLLDARADRLVGILNGIDTRVWDPGTDVALRRNYGAESLDDKARNRVTLQAEMGLAADEDALLVGMISRLTDQKGIDLVLDALPALLERPVQLVVLGAGESRFEQALRDAAATAPDRVAVVVGFDEVLAHQIEAGADAFLMPSRFEPCGLNQMYSQRYGTPPIVRATGGLADAVVDHGTAGGEATGFAFTEATPAALVGAVDRALAVFADRDAWRTICRNGMARDFGWDASARAYREVYRAMLTAQ